MAKPRIFISSTYYDLRHVRSSLEGFVQAVGYEAILSEKGDIAFTPDTPLDESCYREASGADILVLIIGGRYGSETSETKGEADRAFFDRYDSITKEEYRSAIRNNIPTYILIDIQVYTEYQTFQKNRSNKNITYAHVDSINIFHLIDEILGQRKNNPFHAFSRYIEIEEWLKEQWAGYFRELLKRSSQMQQTAALSSQVDALAESNKTLRIYLETLMKNISPEDTARIIQSESSRLDEVEKNNALRENDFFKFLISDNIDLQVFRTVLESSHNIQEFIDKISQIDPPLSGHVADVMHHEAAQSDLNKCRLIVGMPPFDFGDLDLSGQSTRARSRRRKTGAE